MTTVGLRERQRRAETEWRGTEGRGDGADRKGASRGGADGEGAGSRGAAEERSAGTGPLSETGAEMMSRRVQSELMVHLRDEKTERTGDGAEARSAGTCPLVPLVVVQNCTGYMDC